MAHPGVVMILSMILLRSPSRYTNSIGESAIPQTRPPLKLKYGLFKPDLGGEGVYYSVP